MACSDWVWGGGGVSHTSLISSHRHCSEEVTGYGLGPPDMSPRRPMPAPLSGPLWCSPCWGEVFLPPSPHPPGCASLLSGSGQEAGQSYRAGPAVPHGASWGEAQVGLKEGTPLTNEHLLQALAPKPGARGQSSLGDGTWGRACKVLASEPSVAPTGHPGPKQVLGSLCWKQSGCAFLWSLLCLLPPFSVPLQHCCPWS